jgi:hypothetical protein
MSEAVVPTDRASFPRGDHELSILTEIGRILSATLELREAFGQIMQSISDKMDMHRGALVLLDESTGRLRTEAAVGLLKRRSNGASTRWAKGSPATSWRRGGRGWWPTFGRSRTF